MHEEWRKERSYQRINDHTRPKSKWVWGLEKVERVWEVKRQVSIERDRGKWNLKSRWSYLKKTHLDGLRIYGESVEH